MGVDDNGVFGDGGAFVEQAVEQQGLRLGEAKNNVRAEFCGNEAQIVAHLLLVQLFGLPWLLLHERLSLDNFATRGLIAVVDATAAGGAFGVGIHQDAATSPAKSIAHIECHAAGADDGNSCAVTKSNRAVAVNEDGVQDRTDNAGISSGSDADSGSEARV